MRIFSVAPKASVYVYPEPMKMSYGFPGLASIVQKNMNQKPFDGDLFLFVNKKRNYIKILFWSKNGFCMFSKKLPVGVFQMDDKERLSISEMHTLIEVVTIPKNKQKNLLKAA